MANMRKGLGRKSVCKKSHWKLSGKWQQSSMWRASLPFDMSEVGTGYWAGRGVGRDYSFCGLTSSRNTFTHNPSTFIINSKIHLCQLSSKQGPVSSKHLKAQMSVWSPSHTSSHVCCRKTSYLETLWKMFTDYQSPPAYSQRAECHKEPISCRRTCITHRFFCFLTCLTK